VVGLYIMRGDENWRGSYLTGAEKVGAMVHLK